MTVYTYALCKSNTTKQERDICMVVKKSCPVGQQKKHNSDIIVLSMRVIFWSRAGLHNSECSKNQIININLPRAAKVYSILM